MFAAWAETSASAERSWRSIARSPSDTTPTGLVVLYYRDTAHRVLADELYRMVDIVVGGQVGEDPAAHVADSGRSGIAPHGAYTQHEIAVGDQPADLVVLQHDDVADR